MERRPLGGRSWPPSRCPADADEIISFLWKVKHFSSGKESAESSTLTPMLRHLTYKIKSTGPITVAEYMKEVLTNPAKGYYVHHDMIGERGDFITSPEISQIFGELLGIWYISEWMATGKNSTFQLVELGPGRGTLTGDILRVFSQLGSVLKNCDISVHLVEVSQKLSEIQALTLTDETVALEHDAESSVYMKGITKSGIPIFWYRSLQDVPQGYSFYLAHEFFDALPVHKLQPKETRNHVEVCPEAGVIIQILSERLEEKGGAALIADYGHDGTKMDTFRGFCGHKLHDVLIAPGTADLTADVDFSYLRRMTQGKVASLGPIQQHNFLKNMGIDVRLKVLLDNSRDATTRQQLIHGYDMLMNPKKMGERFNFFALLPHHRLSSGDTPQSKSLPPPVAGFGELIWK
ncbi:protein arginine methyltransferase NDUFAF7, mitochondrial isoform X3 [Macrotis lagotis]|uniref:protein arginine methyltransferase NDUFAF7, mitochondrial isoform X3 n=1 Tax=Macrotis lagotis TaxID=92651 RepID=UPI003D69788A